MRVLVTLTPQLLAQLDAWADEEGLSRSAALRELIERVPGAMPEEVPSMLMAEGLGDTPRQFIVIPRRGTVVEIEGDDSGGFGIVAVYGADRDSALEDEVREFVAQYDRHSARFLAEHGTTTWEHLEP